MIYNIVYDAVKKKIHTTPVNDFIGNVEMAAAIGIILDEEHLNLDFENIDTPEKLKEEILALVDGKKLSDTSQALVDVIERYKVKKMVNEKMEDLIILARDKKKNT